MSAEVAAIVASRDAACATTKAASEYAIKNAHPDVKKNFIVHKAEDDFPYKDKQFDLTISLATLHNLEIFGLKNAIIEIERVSKEKYIMVEAYRNEKELFNLQCWALTANAFFSEKEWEYIDSRITQISNE